MLTAWFSNVPADCSAIQGHVVTTLHSSGPPWTGRPGLQLFADRAAQALRSAASMTGSADSFGPVLDLALTTGNWHAASVGTVIGTWSGTVGGRVVGPVAGDTIAATADEAEQLDRRQFELGQGPGPAAIRAGGPVTVGDVACDCRWPDWRRSATKMGVTSAMSLPLFTDCTIGVLNLYRFARPGQSEFDPAQNALDLGPESSGTETPGVDTAAAMETAAAESRTVELLAAHVSVLLAHFLAMQNLRRAIDARNVIGQAQGVLMERYQLTPATAFAVLRRYSNQSNRKVSVVAEQLVSSGTLPEIADRFGDGDGWAMTGHDRTS